MKSLAYLYLIALVAGYLLGWVYLYPLLAQVRP
jgi:hypothetical protein